MKRPPRSASHGMIKLVSLTLCYSLITTTLLIPSSSARESHSPSNSGVIAQPGLLGFPARVLASFLNMLQGGGLPSVPGPNLPDLTAARQVQEDEPEAPPSIASEQSCEECVPCPDCVINHKPFARPGGPYFGSPSQAIEFSGLGSFDPDPDDEITDYVWTFGDSNPAVEVHGVTPSHAYASAGVYTVTLRVKDLQNVSSDLATTTATVNGGPTPTPTPGASPTPTPDQANAATFISQSVPSTMTAGERYNVSVTMRNTGSNTWSAAHLYRLGSQSPQDNSLWGRARAYLSTAVAPGAQGTFSFSVLAPYSGADEPPPATFQWRMVQDGIGYFGDVTQSVSVAITSNYQSGNPGVPEVGPFSDLFMSRIAIEHRTGQPGEDLLSGNYNWGLSLLNLTGRANLNLNLGLSYNSLATWTRVDPPYNPLLSEKDQQPTSWTFDADRGFPSVGFRLGFPTIQGPFSNVQTGAKSYLLLMTSGARVELRRIGLSNIYEAADSSYLQLVDGGVSGMLLRTTDGSRLAYLLIGGEYRCTEIKDRNGNYITIKYDPLNGSANPGRMTSVIDTLGRTINFTYDSNYRLQEIRQVRSGQSPQVWASFGYSDIEVQPNFMAAAGNGGEELSNYEIGDPGPTIGLSNSTVSVLTQVGLADGSRYGFEYSSWGQVTKITHYAADSIDDNHPLSSVSYNLPQDSGHPRADCPRFTQRQDWAENFNNSSPTATTFEFDPNGEWGKVTGPDGTAYKEFFTTDYTSWQRGLVTRTESYSADSGTPKKITITDWTQDNLSLAYPLNPRATTTTVSDSDGNRLRTTIEYDLFSLPSDVYEWGPSGASDWSLLRRTHTDYELSAAYVNQRLIGITKQQFLFGPEDNGQRLYRKASYEYDAELLASQGNPVQHDANYGVGVLIRGNVTKALRWDVNHENNINDATASTVGYNTCGSAIFRGDARGHQTAISYADSFSTNGSNSTTAPGLTLAYPTTVTIHDPDAISSTTKYNYDLGLVTRTQDPKGAAVTTEYDAAGRVKKVTNTISGAYTRFVYPATQLIVNKFTTIKDLTTETYTATVFDGAGRVRAVAGDFPNSTGHYSGQLKLYDANGQVIQQTRPTEMNSQWAAAGDDVAGWRSSAQTFDWKGRPLVSTNTDGTTKTASYEGCGCAGGSVMTLTDEGTVVGGVDKKRQQKIYSDSFGRTFKTEILNWDGAGSFGTGGSVYSTTVTNYNARDQVTTDRHYQGTEASGVYQETAMTYDGYGRLQTKHVPQQNAGTAHSWIYFADDTVQSATDARGATATYTYNNRGLVKTIAYDPPAGVPDTPSVAFEYDAAGNRISMTDGLGSVGYTYDTLSQVRSETRIIDGVGTFPLVYDYHPTGQLKKITDPMNGSINYSYDDAGRTRMVTGSDTLYGGVSNYATSFQYRAWGGLKQYSYGNSSQHLVSLAYTSRGKISQYQATFNSPFATQSITGQYQYSADGRLRSSTEQTDHRHDRAYVYDHAARLTQALTGAEARGETPTPGWDPFKQNYGYNAWDNLTSRTGHHWGTNEPALSATYINDRNTNSQWQYSSDGDVLRQTNGQITRQHDIDAAGRQVSTTEPPRRPGKPTLTITEGYDGDGKRIAHVQNNVASYEIRSSVLAGQVITELNAQGAKTRGWVFANGAKLARQSLNEITWIHEAPDGSGEWESAGTLYRTLELDPMRDDVGVDNPYSGGGDGLGSYPSNGDPTDFQMGCAVDNYITPCEIVGKFFVKQAKRVEQIGTGVRVPIYDWVLNPDEAPGDMCTNGVCPPGAATVTVHDTGGHFEIAGYETISNYPAMRAMIPQTPEQILENAVRGAEERLNDKNTKCGEAFKELQKNNPDFDPAKFLANYAKDGSMSIGNTYVNISDPSKPMLAPFPNDVPAMSTRIEMGGQQFPGITVFNRNNIFFARDIIPNQGSRLFGLNTNQIRQLIVLHELVHILDSNGFFNDLGDKNKVAEIDRKILENCFPEFQIAK